ncbi:axial regulator YABBY 5-like [Salvia splendens]|uniref:axial regulator YABBY 5-like n=1 Tax=Salvia splendens TaxID=180675 RepID=UPI001C26D15F|nr:axial regulator YABBY 5-like [Salvia splendens]
MPALESLQEQICYVECCICNTILLVIVPYNSLAMVVTINCGHCDNIFSLNMLHLFPSINQHRKLVADEEEDDDDDDDNDDEDRDYVWCNHVIQKLIMNDLMAICCGAAPEKKKRGPTAYNRFIKYEIKRLKAEHPNITHKEAFSAAAKNWAHCPQREYRDGQVSACDEGDTNYHGHAIHCPS